MTSTESIPQTVLESAFLDEELVALARRARALERLSAAPPHASCAGSHWRTSPQE